MKIKGLASYLLLALIPVLFNAAVVFASGDNYLLPEPGILLLLGSALMAFAFYRRIKNK